MITMMPVKKAITILPILLLYVFGGGGGDSAATSGAARSEAVQPVYQWDTMTAQNQFTAEDGTELMHYSYQLLTLNVTNLEELLPEAAEAARRNVENFNSRMNTLMEESLEVGQMMTEDAADMYSDWGLTLLPFYDETSASCRRTGELLSVRVSDSSYAGGAHPNYTVSSYLFDLHNGQFIDPTQIAEDPRHFQTGASEALVRKAEALDCREDYWSDYAEIIEHWNEGTVLFDEEGMLVIYSPYLLGPYSMGEVELRLSYEELAPLVGPGGLERLGVQTDR